MTSATSSLCTQESTLDFTQDVMFQRQIVGRRRSQPPLKEVNFRKKYVDNDLTFANTAVTESTIRTETLDTAIHTSDRKIGLLNDHALSVATRSSRRTTPTRNSAVRVAEAQLSGVAAPIVRHTRNGCALCAAQSSYEISEVNLERAHETVLSVKPCVSDETGEVIRENVYDITVEHEHEFFANDILVANCLIWAEELAAWRYLQACWEQMRFGLRVGPRPRWCASTTPKPRPLIKKLVKETPHNVVVTRASTRDNPHLQDEVREALHEEYGGTQLGRQELDADLLEEDRDALWTRATLDRYRLIAPPDAAYRARTVVGVDPSGGAGEQGIVVVTKSLPEALAGLISDPHAYAGGANPPVPRPGARSIHHGVVLDDRTCCLPPAGWGRRAVRAAIDWDADELVVERNFGGAMATATLLDACEAEGVDVPVREVVASRGKRVRAEPVSALSERGRWHMAGNFPELEDQCCTWTEESNYSPDRLDAMVWPAWRLKLVSVRTRGVGRLPLREMSETPISNGTA